MQTEIAKKENLQQVAIEGQKRKAWGDMGVIIYRQELELQVSAQASLAKLAVMPTKIEEVPAAEAILKAVKADCTRIADTRKAITAKFDAVAQRLMEAEKSFATPVAEFAKEIIKVKQAHEKREAEKLLRVQELKRIRETLTTQLAGHDAEYKKWIADRVAAAYSYALGDGNIQPGDELIKFLKARIAKLTDEDFTPARPNPAKTYATAEEVAAIVMEVWKISPQNYVALYVTELHRRFADYDIAFKNKEQALAIANSEKESKLQEIQTQQQNQVVAAQLEAAAIDYTIEPSDVKALKKCYEIDMEETYDNAMKIIAAFLANKSLCYPKTQVKKWFNFNADSAGKALAKVKSEDNNFAPAGITFKQVDKL